MKLKNKKTKAFTLAEVLITLGIIGVITAISVPALLGHINSKNKAERIRNILFKLSQATDKMQAESGISNYEDTEDFVNELSKHMKILQICTKDELDKCWPYDEISIQGEQKNINSYYGLGLDSGEYADPVGIITGDGTPMLLRYNTECEYNDRNAPVADGYTGMSSSLSCIAGVFDWNGGEAPNGYSVADADIVPINTALRDWAPIIPPEDAGWHYIYGRAVKVEPVEYNGTMSYYYGAQQACEKMGGNSQMLGSSDFLYNLPGASDGIYYGSQKTELFSILGLPIGSNFSIYQSVSTKDYFSVLTPKRLDDYFSKPEGNVYALCGY